MSHPDIRSSFVEFTRPADTTAYAVGDAVSNSTSSPVVLTLPSVVSYPGEDGIIRGATLLKSTATTANATFRLHLYKVAPTATNDNAALSVLYADRQNYIGSIEFTAKAAGGGAAFAHGVVADSKNNQIMELPFHSQVASGVGDANLYGVLEATAAYAPGNAETFFIRPVIQKAS